MAAGHKRSSLRPGARGKHADAPDEVRNIAITDPRIDQLIAAAKLSEVLAEPYQLIVDWEVEDEVTLLMKQGATEDKLKRIAWEKRVELTAAFALKVRLWARHHLCTVDEDREKELTTLTRSEFERERLFCNWARPRDGAEVVAELEERRAKLVGKKPRSRTALYVVASRARRKLASLSPSLARALAIPLGWVLAPYEAKAASGLIGMAHAGRGVGIAVVILGTMAGIAGVAECSRRLLQVAATTGVGFVEQGAPESEEHLPDPLLKTADAFHENPAAGIAGSSVSSAFPGTTTRKTVAAPGVARPSLEDSPSPSASQRLRTGLQEEEYFRAWASSGVFTNGDHIMLSAATEPSTPVDRIELYLDGSSVKICHGVRKCNAIVGPIESVTTLRYVAELLEAGGATTQTDVIRIAYSGLAAKSSRVSVVASQNTYVYGDKILFTATGNDTSGVARLEIYMSDVLVKSCDRVTACEVSLGPFVTYTTVRYAAKLVNARGDEIVSGYQEIECQSQPLEEPESP